MRLLVDRQRAQRDAERRYFTLRHFALSAVFRIVPEDNKKSRFSYTEMSKDMSTSPSFMYLIQLICGVFFVHAQ